jgi:hypothetical protein
MADRAIDDKPSDTLVVVSGEGFWTGSSTLPHLHHLCAMIAALVTSGRQGVKISAGSVEAKPPVPPATSTRPSWRSVAVSRERP